MKLGKIKVEEEEVDMTPMIDMVFLLLIFFIVASHFDALEKVEIEQPVANNASIPKEMTDRRTITITEDESIFVGNRLSDLDDVYPMVKKADAEVDDLKIFLRVDRRAKHKKVREVMRKCAEAGSAEIIFSTHEK